MANNILSDSLKAPNLKTSANEIIKAGLDLVGSGIDSLSGITGIPIYSMILKPAANGIIAVREYHLMKMIAHFFENFDDLTANQKAEFSIKLRDDANYEDFTEKILYYLDNIEDKRKAQIIGKLSRNLALSKINVDDYYILVDIVKQIPISDLRHLKKWIDERIKTSLTTKKEDFETDFINSDFWNFEISRSYESFLKERQINIFSTYGILIQFQFNSSSAISKARSDNRIFGYDNDPVKIIQSALEELKREMVVSKICKTLYIYGLKDVSELT